MSFLLDTFGFVSVILAGFARSAQFVFLGSLIFMIVLARSQVNGSEGSPFGRAADAARRIGAIALTAMIAAVLVGLALHAAILSAMMGEGPAHALGSVFAQAQLVRIIVGLVALVLLQRIPAQFLLVAFIAVEIGAGIATSHAIARMDDRLLLSLSTGLHLLAGAAWIGGLPAFLWCLNKITDPDLLKRVCRFYSRLALASVGAILGSGAIMLTKYVGSTEAMYGTAYGMMLGTKFALFLTLLGLGAANFLAIRGMTVGGMAVDGLRKLNPMKRFVEVEFGIGITVLFVATSITSLPPAIDLEDGRASLTEILDRLEPRWPDLMQPGKDHLGIERVQRVLDAKAESAAGTIIGAYLPGAKQAAPRNADDVLWSEYNHHIAGIFVLLIGALAVLKRTGRARWARHWPLLFVGLAWFLFARSESEAWPIGSVPFLLAIGNPEYLQHRLFMLLMICFGLFEWSVRTGFLRAAWAGYVFPICCGVGGLMLLTHSHSISNAKELLLIEMTHMPLAVFGIWAGWARWLELRLDGSIKISASWAWPSMLCLVGMTLLAYRET